jgi:hypothetical protein
MAMFHIYVDESGKLNSKDGYTSLCGYLAHADDWESFSRMWQRCCLRWKVPPLHMSKIMKPDGPDIAYKPNAWDDVRSTWGRDWEKNRNDMLEEFARIVASLPLVAIGAVVDTTAYKELRAKGCLVAERDPNVFSFHRVIMEGLRSIKDVNQLGTLSIIVDDDPDNAWGYYDLAKGLRNHPDKETFACVSERLHGLCFGDDKAYPGLQAADILSWVSRRFMVDKKNDEDHLPSGLLRLLTFDGLHQPRVYTREKLMTLSENTKEALKGDSNEK